MKKYQALSEMWNWRF